MKYFGILITIILIISCDPYKNTYSYDYKIFDVNEGNQDSLIIYTIIDQNWLDSMNSKYSWENFDEYDNLFYEYIIKFSENDPAIRSREIELDVWSKLTREQKILTAFLKFTGSFDNGGLDQFFYNEREFTLAFLQTLDEIPIPDLRKDYYNSLEIVVGEKIDSINYLKTINGDPIDWERKWNIFFAGSYQSPIGEHMKKYYYTTEYKKYIYKIFTDYIDQNMNKFVKIKTVANNAEHP
jgi:hypothetical protein